MSTNHQTIKLALVSMPWSLFSRPSIQLGTLKSYLENSGHFYAEVDCFHPYICAAKDISIETYSYLCKKSWAGEALYSSILYPENVKNSQKVFTENCRDNMVVASKFESLVQVLKDHLDCWVNMTDFSRYRLVGFSVCFSQLFASLAAAAKIKNRYPNIKIVFGGSTCVGKIGKSLAEQYSQVDYIVEGEGETQLEALCLEFLQNDKQNSHAPPLTMPENQNCTAEVIDLNALPIPDYHSYFQELKDTFPSLPFTPTLPIEFSRGCWWKKCSFCNLNLQWHGYRHKKASRMTKEVEWLRDKFQCLDFTFCDNALPVKEASDFFDRMSKDDVDMNFFAEIRAVNNPSQLRQYKNGGLHAVQVGIESLSNSLLEKMVKGVSVIENIAIMKYCAENNIVLDGNLIIEFPGSTDNEVKETLAALEFVLPYNPLSAASFFLGYGSPVAANPARFSIRRVVRHKNNTCLFPEEHRENLDFLIMDYHGDKVQQKKRWAPVREKIKSWHHFHESRKGKLSSPLSYRNGNTFMLIRQERPAAAPLLHRLHGASREIYLFCSITRNFDEIRERFPKINSNSLLNFFHDLSKKHLLYNDGDSYLSLAIRQQRQ